MRLDTTTAVATPERVRFRYRIAGPGRRAVAWSFDAVVQGIVLAVVGAFAALIELAGLGGVGMGGMLVVVFLLQWFYGAFFESMTSGRTPGKMLLSLRVVTVEGAPAAPRQFILRNLLTGADFLPVGFGVGVLAMTADARLRRIGDRVAGTVVVDESLTTMNAAVQIEPPITEEERRALPARVDLSREETRAIEAFLRRRSRLSSGRARELAAILGGPLAVELGLTDLEPERVLVLAYARATGRDRDLG